MGQTFTQGDPVTASYTCTDPSGIAQCEGTVANGAALSTATVGNFTFTVNARDNANNPITISNNYSVVAPTTPVGGDTPPTLNLTLGTPGSFTAFIPGLARDYNTTMTASVTSTAENATLTVADPSATNTGKLVNGAFALTNPLQVGAVSTYEYAVKPMLAAGAVGTRRRRGSCSTTTAPSASTPSR